MENSNAKTRNMAIIGVLIAGLLGSNIYWMMNNTAKTETITQQTQAIDEAANVKAELEKQYYESLSQLESLRSSNTELNKVLDSQKAQLAQQHAKIDDLIRNKKDLGKAREELSSLKGQVAQYMAEIDRLKGDNKALTERVTVIETEKTQLQTTVAAKTEQIAQTEKEKADIAAAKAQVETQNEALSKKVNRGSVIEVSDIQTINVNSKGKKSNIFTKTKGYKTSMKLRANEVTDGGDETFYVSIVDPLGEVMADEANQVLELNNHEKVRYTKAVKTSYSNKEAALNFDWGNDKKLKSGTYEINIYNKGFLCGKGTYKW